MANARRIVKAAATISVLALALAALLPTITGRPIVSYASSGSMEPTIGTLDGFLVNPYPVGLEVGDIIVFESFTQGGPAVHRIVGADAEGWITRGDANARNDQDIGEPSITRDRILGQVVTKPDGTPIVLDSLGVSFLEARAKVVLLEAKVGGPRALAALAFLATAALLLAPSLVARKKRRLPARIPMRARVALRRLLPRGVLGRHVGLALLLVAVASTAFAATHARQDVMTTMIVLQDPGAADDTRAAGPGGELRREIEITSLGLVPTIVIVDGEPGRIRADDASHALRPGAAGTAVAWQIGGPTVGIQEDAIEVWRYPAFLPERTIVVLHDAAPGSPYVLLGGLATALGALWFRAMRIATLPVARHVGIREDWL